MKRSILILTMVVALALSVLGQTKEPKEKMAGGGNSATEQKLAQMEKELWEGWKNKDSAVFKKYMASKSLNVGGDGVMGTEQEIESLAKSDCNVTSYSVEQPQFQWYDKNTVMMVYKAAQDAVCGGKKVPPEVMASSVWMKEGGQWKAAFHQETPATK
jgi:hypothetical protein